MIMSVNLKLRTKANVSNIDRYTILKVVTIDEYINYGGDVSDYCLIYEDKISLNSSIVALPWGAIINLSKIERPCNWSGVYIEDVLEVNSISCGDVISVSNNNINILYRR